MEPKGVFEIHVGQEGQEGSVASGAGYTVRIGWIESVPYIVDLGSTGAVLVNRSPIQPHAPRILGAGDTVNIGNTSLTWAGMAPAVGLDEEPDATEAETMVAPGAFTERPAPVYSIVVQTPSQMLEVPLLGELVGVGRSRDNDIHLDDEHISRHHAQLVRDPRGYEIVDLGSAFGVRLRGKGVSRHLLQDGDIAWLSNDTSLTFKVRQPVAIEEEGKPPADRADETTVVPRRRSDTEADLEPEETLVIDRPGRQAPAAVTPIITASPTIDLGEDQELRAPDETLSIPRERKVESGDAAFEKTVVVQREATAPPELSEPDESGLSLGDWDDPTLMADSDETVVVSRPSAEPPTAEAEDATLVVLRKEPGPPAAQGPAPTPRTMEERVSEAADDAERETAYIDMLRVIEEEPDLVFEPTTLARDTRVPHLVVYMPHRTWEVQFSKERLTIGRGEDNDIVLPDRHASRRHAWIERRRDTFVIREAQSRNGIWLGKQRIREHTLRDGDVLSIGQARLVFKGGFSSNELTLISIPRIDGKPTRRPVVFVPGMMGSELWLGSERIWPNAKYLVSQPEIYKLPGDPRIEARNILSDVVVVPGLVKLRQYSGLGDYMETGLGYTRGKDFLEFAYDWRHDVRLAAQRLADTIERWQVSAPITLIAHSLGTLVGRYYIEKLGGKRHIERLVLMGGPHYGTPKGLAAILNGPGMLPFGMGDERMRRILATFPSAYQILPIYPCIMDQDETYIDALKDTSWLPEHQRPFLGAARSFRSELGSQSSVPCVSIIGYGLKTILRIKIHRQPSGQWEKVEFVEDAAGDLSVPSGSAVLKGSEIHPVYQEHGSLYVDDDVRMRLKIELTRSTTWQRR
jgi:pSer/pThr/pTyr-binding forkhead associated (FHA) protein/pimeloyl-ACP methyl ester carboxylesterase